MITPERKVELEAVEIARAGFLRIKRYALRHSTPNGDMSGVVIRELMERGDAAAVIIYDPERDQVLLTEEFRIGHVPNALSPEDCWSLGPVAGMIDEGEESLDCVLREAREEVGIELRSEGVNGPLTYYSSPGGTSERLFIYVATADISTADPQKVDNDEGEFTHPVIVERKALDALVMSGKAPASLVAGVLLLNATFPRNPA